MNLIDNLLVSYIKNQQKWIDKVKVEFSTYVDVTIDRAIKNVPKGAKLIFAMGTWSFIDLLGYDIIEEEDDLYEFLDNVSQLINYSDPFPMEYVGKYNELRI